MMIKKLLLLIASLFFAFPAYASQQLILGGTADVLNATTTEFMYLTGRGNWVATENQASVPINTAGTIKNLRIGISAAPGAAKSYAFTVRKTSSGTPADTSLTCTISGAVDVSCTDLTNTFTVAATDEIQIKSVPTGTPAIPFAYFVIEFVGDTAAESIYGGGSSSTTTPTGFTRYHGLAAASVTGSEEQGSTLSPMAGTTKKLIVNIGTAPGAGVSRAFTLRKNSADTALTCTISGAATTNCVDNTNTVTIAAGDMLTVSNVPTGTVAATTVRVGAVILADTNGEFAIMGGTGSGTGSAFATNWERFQGIGGWNANAELNVYNIISAVTLKNFYIKCTTAPGAGKNYVYTIRDDLADTALAITVADAATTGNVTSDVSVAASSLMSITGVPTGTPTATTSQYGAKGFFTPAGAARRVMLVT